MSTFVENMRIGALTLSTGMTDSGSTFFPVLTGRMLYSFASQIILSVLIFRSR